MKIVVCIKLVPAVTDVKIDPETGTLIRDGLESEVNPFDMYAIEEAIRLKEKHCQGQKDGLYILYRPGIGIFLFQKEG